MAPIMNLDDQGGVFLFPFQVGLPVTHPLVERFIQNRMPGQDVVDVPRTYIGSLGRCYDHVVARVKQRGGNPLFGWQLTMWPNRYVEAMHHVVWVNPDGILEDLTAAPYVAAGDVAFVVDKRQDYQIIENRGPNGASAYGIRTSVRPIFMQIDKRDETKNYIEAFQRGIRREEVLSLLRAEPRYEGASGQPCPCGSMLAFERCHARLRVPKTVD